MIQFLKSTVADMVNAVARSVLAEENARLKVELEKAKDAVRKILRLSETTGAAQGDQIRDLRAKLEATEHANAKQQHAIRELEGQLASRDLEIAEISAAAERRQPVDRERAIATVLAKLEFMSRDEACEAVTAILGAEKAEKKVDGGRLPRFELISGEMHSSLSGSWVRMEDVSEAIDVAMEIGQESAAKAEPPAFTPAPTGEAPSEELPGLIDFRGRLNWLVNQLGGDDYGRPEVEAVKRISDHAKLAKRVRELENELLKQNARATRLGCELNQTTADRDSNASEVARLKTEALRTCPADKMTYYEIGSEIKAALYPTSQTFANLADGGRKAAELFGKGAK